MSDSCNKNGLKYNALGNTGMNISEYGFGAAGFSSFYGETEESECIETVKEALKCGINYIDTAPWYGYGRSEKILGKVSKQRTLIWYFNRGFILFPRSSSSIWVRL